MELRCLIFESWYEDWSQDSQILSLDIETGFKIFMITFFVLRLVLRQKIWRVPCDWDYRESHWSSLIRPYSSQRRTRGSHYFSVTTLSWLTPVELAVFFPFLWHPRLKVTKQVWRPNLLPCWNWFTDFVQLFSGFNSGQNEDNPFDGFRCKRKRNKS